MLIFFLLYVPLAVSFVGVVWFSAALLTRRSLTSRLPRTPGPAARRIGQALGAPAVIDDAGISWRLRDPDQVRVTLPYSFPPTVDAAAAARSGFDDWRGRYPLSGSGAPDQPQPPHLALIFRWQRTERANRTLAAAFGLPLDMICRVGWSVDEQGRLVTRPAGSAWMPQDFGPASTAQGGGGAGGFRVRSALISRIVSQWSAFEADLTQLLTPAAIPPPGDALGAGAEALEHAGSVADFRRAYIITPKAAVWLEQPLWPAGEAPPAPFLLNLIEDQASLLAVYPGHAAAAALEDADWLAAQIRWFAQALPVLTANTVKAQRWARTALDAAGRRAREAPRPSTLFPPPAAPGATVPHPSNAPQQARSALREAPVPGVSAGPAIVQLPPAEQGAQAEGGSPAESLEPAPAAPSTPPPQAADAGPTAATPAAADSTSDDPAARSGAAGEKTQHKINPPWEPRP